jgi:hypothetical protein
VVSEPKHETSRTSAFDANSGGQVAMVERITCRVCDLRIADPNG